MNVNTVLVSCVLGMTPLLLPISRRGRGGCSRFPFRWPLDKLRSPPHALDNDVWTPHPSARHSLPDADGAGAPCESLLGCVIAEAPSSCTIFSRKVLPLANFGTSLFEQDHTSITGTCYATIKGISGAIGSLAGSVQEITMVTNSGTAKAIFTFNRWHWLLRDVASLLAFRYKRNCRKPLC
jgi:hypothetical protein